MVCLAIGLIMKMRPSVIVKRATMSSIALAMLAYILVSIIERYSGSQGTGAPTEAE